MHMYQKNPNDINKAKEANFKKLLNPSIYKRSIENKQFKAHKKICNGINWFTRTKNLNENPDKNR